MEWTGYLGIIASISGIIGVSLFSISAYLWGKILRPRYYRWRYRHIITNTNSDYVLAVALKKNMANMVAKIKEQANGSLPQLRGLQIVEVCLDNNCTAATPSKLVAMLQGIRMNMADIGKYKIHLFYGGPAVLPAFIGGFFYGKDKAYVYHQNSNREYECWGLVNIEKDVADK